MVTVLTPPPGTSNEPDASVSTLALVLATPATLESRALSVRTVTVPSQLLTVAGQSTLMATVADLLACKEVLAMLASGLLRAKPGFPLRLPAHLQTYPTVTHSSTRG
jgi:hypothetical protein